MLKWCPKPFSEEARPERNAQTAQPAFEAGLASDTSTATSGLTGGQPFEKDPRLVGGSSLWDLMSETEKTNLLELARADLHGEYQARENEIRENHRLEMVRVREELETRLENWTRAFSSDSAHDRQERAVEAAGLAVAMARKIIRETAHVDQEMVVRTLETTLYKAQDAHPLTAVLHPDDAEFLVEKPDLMARLRIEKVVPDRRMEKGGCRVRAGSREWDATISRQVDTLAAIIEETLAAGECDLVSRPGEHDDPGLE
jgi:hypothetical protein